MKNLYAVVMAGGSGTRLWPISRDYYPKQFLNLIGDKTLIQQTFLRIKKITTPQKIFISTNRIFVDEIVAQLKPFGFKKENIIIQPDNKDTGPSLAWASKKIFDKDKSAIILNCPSDHLINPDSEFISAVKLGYTMAVKKGCLVTFGIKPTHPSPEYGYITIDSQQSMTIHGKTSYKIKKFIEKPEAETAKKLITKKAVWNSGIYMWRAETILDEIKTHAPDIEIGLESRKKYFSLQSIAIDKSVSEKSDRIWVVPVNFQWRDIGSWKVLYDLLEKNSENNVLNDRVVALNTRNSLIYGTEGRVVTAINVDNLIIVDTSDSVLVAHKDSVAEIKSALKQIENSKLVESLNAPLVSIIIPLHDNSRFAEQTLVSTILQKYKNIERIVVGNSRLTQTSNLYNYKYLIEEWHTLRTTSRFDQINKGLELANGEIITILEPGNSYIDGYAVTKAVEALEPRTIKMCWGDLIYTNHDKTDKVGMYWKTGPYTSGNFQRGWMPPFATVFIKKEIYDKYGNYNTKFSVAADYELLLRFIEKKLIKSKYIPQVLVKMTGKGITIKNVVDRYKGNLETYQAWKNNGMNISPIFILSKNLAKLAQLVNRNSAFKPKTT